MIFQSDHSFRPADGVQYATLKRLHVLHLENTPLQPLTSVEAPFNLSRERWWTYDGPRLLAAAHGARGQSFISPFPGHTLPGPGANGSSVRRHSLMIDWRTHLSTLTSLPCPEGHHWPTETLENSLEQIRLETATEHAVAVPSLDERALLEYWHKRDFRMIACLIRRAWDVHDQVPASDDLVLKLEALSRELLVHVTDPIAFLFEAYDLLRRAEIQHELGITPIGMGIYEGTWLEVGMLPLKAIHPTELVVTTRIVMELETLTSRGFAPIAVNEFGCNTDGSHRQTACMFWNACTHSRATKGSFQTRIEDGLKRMKDPKPLLVSELRRLAREIDYDPSLRDRVKEAIKAATPHQRLSRVPVMLVPEYSAGTVVKGPYDRGEASLHVCPQLYRMMAQNGSLTLPARGPYHGTDRALVPWFKML